MERNKTMKNKHITIVALAAAALATSCASEDIAEPQKQNQGEPKTVTLTASVNDVQTRVGMTKDGSKASFYWHEDDKIFVQTVNGSSYTGTEFSIKETASNATSATFTGQITEGEVAGYAVYPYDSEKQQHSFTSENALTYVLPASYDNYTVGSNIFSNTTPTNMPMLGTIADGKISFKCLGGLAVIRIASMPVAEGTLAVTADQQLSGDFTVSNLSSTTTPEITTTTGSDDNKKVSFTFNNATKDGVGVFYLPLAVGSYTNVKIEIKDKSTNTWWMSNNSTLTINRAGVTAVPLASTDMGKIVKNTDGTYTINSQYTFRDLGLSVLWATMNVGATTETGYGDFYSWGETDTKDSFSSPSTYADNPTTLPADHDAATANWGSACRMPTNTEFGELTNNCDWSWTTESSINGCKVTCKKQGSTNNSIFLPAAGLKYSSSTIGQGSYGDYLSSSLSDESDCAYYATFDSTGCKNGNKGKRWLGYTVRAVADKPTILE